MPEDHSSEPVRAVAYYRMSTDRQEASVPQQREWARRAADAHGVAVVAEFQDDGVSGSEIDKRRGLAALLSYCERPPGAPVAAVVVWDPDRLSRADSIRTAAVVCRLVDAGVTRLLTQEGWVDFDSDLDRVLFHLRQDLSRSAYSKSLSKSTTRAALSRARAGLWVAGKPPLAYALGGDGRLAPGRPEEVELVLWLFRAYADTDDSLGDLARALDARGVPPPRGPRWRRDTVRKVLVNRAYVGDLVWNATHQGKYHRVKGGEVHAAAARKARRHEPNAAADLIVFEGAHPALVDRATFARVAAKLVAGRWRRTTPAPGGGAWVLSGLAYCGACGGRLTGRTERHARPGGRAYTYRRLVCNANAAFGKGACRSYSVQQGRLLRSLGALLKESFTDPGRRRELQAQVEEEAGRQAREADGRALALEGRVAEWDRKIQQAKGNLLLLPRDLVADAAATLRAWQGERDLLAAERDVLRRQAVDDAADVNEVAAALGELEALQGALADAPPALVRTILRRLLVKVTVVFDAAAPANRASATALDLTFTPAAVKYLSPSGAKRQQVCLTLRLPLPA
jgi:site-specific DNA recombinase